MNILLAGAPGVGKTTIIRRVVRCLDLRVGGFFTEEIREEGVRRGFKIMTLGGKEGILAHVNRLGSPRVGRYGVNLNALEGIAVKSMEDALEKAQLIVIDEIGKMELHSPAFREMTLRCLDSGTPTLGTIIWRSHPFADGIKSRRDVEVIQVNRENRKRLEGEIVQRLVGHGTSQKRT